MNSKQAFLALLFTLSLLSTAATVEKIIATVGGEVITNSDLENAMKVHALGIQKDQKLSGGALRARVLDTLIDDKVLDMEIEKAKAKTEIRVEDHEVDAVIDRILRSGMTREAFEGELAKKGYTLEKYREELSHQILRQKFVGNRIGSKISISERELKDYFDSHREEFKSASAVQLAQIWIPFGPETKSSDLGRMQGFAAEIAAAAKTASSFDELAARFSGKPYRVQGGSLGVVAVKDLQPAVAKVVTELDKGEVSRPLLTPVGISIFKVIDRAATSANDFASARDRIYDTLYRLKMDAAIKSFVTALRKKTAIQIHSLGTT